MSRNDRGVQSKERRTCRRGILYSTIGFLTSEQCVAVQCGPESNPARLRYRFIRGGNDVRTVGHADIRVILHIRWNVIVWSTTRTALPFGAYDLTSRAPSDISTHAGSNRQVCPRAHTGVPNRCARCPISTAASFCDMYV
jgi:hypothetical protein